MAIDNLGIISIACSIISMICAVAVWYMRSKELKRQMAILHAIGAGDMTKIPEAIKIYEKETEWYRKQKDKTQFASSALSLVKFYKSMGEWKPDEKDVLFEKGARLMEETIKYLEDMTAAALKKNDKMKYMDISLNLLQCYAQLAKSDSNKRGQSLKRSMELMNKALILFPMETDPSIHGAAVGAYASMLMASADEPEPEKPVLEARRMVKDVVARLDRIEERAKLRELLKIMAEADIRLSGINKDKTYIVEGINILQEIIKYEKASDEEGNYLSLSVMLGNAYSILAELDEKASNLNKALAVAQDIAGIGWLRAKIPKAYGGALCMMGEIRMHLARVENKKENLQKAIRSFKDGLAVDELRSDPQMSAEIRKNIQKAESILRGEADFDTPSGQGAGSQIEPEKVL
jgi:tetratricopeptide (TPR) repeat protein